MDPAGAAAFVRVGAVRRRRARRGDARLVGHSGTTVTELVYRHQLRPVIQTGATVMDRLFGSAAVQARSHAVGHAGNAAEAVTTSDVATRSPVTSGNVGWSQGDSNP